MPKEELTIRNLQFIYFISNCRTTLFDVILDIMVDLIAAFITLLMVCNIKILLY